MPEDVHRCRPEEPNRLHDDEGYISSSHIASGNEDLMCPWTLIAGSGQTIAITCINFRHGDDGLNSKSFGLVVSSDLYDHF